MHERYIHFFADTEDNAPAPVAVKGVEHDVRVAQQFLAVRLVDESFARLRLDAGIDRLYARRGGARLWRADILLRRVKLAIQVVLGERVSVDKDEPSDAGAREYLDHPAAESSAAYDGGAAFEKPRLPLRPQRADRALVARRTYAGVKRGDLDLAESSPALLRRLATDGKRYDGQLSARNAPRPYKR